MKKMTIATYVVSLVGVATYMFHFWYEAPASTATWNVSGACAIFSIYAGIIGRSQAESELGKAWLLVATVIGCLVLLGLTFSAIFLFVPAIR